MDGRYIQTEDIRTLWTVSTKFAQQMTDLTLMRPYYHALVSCIETLSYLPDPTQETKICGSIGEGIWYPFDIDYHRDIDMIHVFPDTIAVETASEKDQNDQDMYVCLVDREGSLPGYCKLRQLHHGSSLVSRMHITKECNGINYLPNTWPRYLLYLLKSTAFLKYLKTKPDLPLGPQFPCDFPDSVLGPLAERGPSISNEIRGIKEYFELSPRDINITKQDNVLVIKHPRWPLCASEWRDRIRCYGWPSKQQIQNIISEGIYLAPVGSIQSEHQDIQWRYSFNEAERQLVRSFNPTQINCYVLLKMLVSAYITPHFDDDVISSYHIKTLMFWAVEQTDPHLWVSRNLVERILHILKKLLDCVAKLSCPSYFIPEENLFAGKITPVNREPVSQILLTVMNDGWVSLTRLKHFAKNEEFVQSLYKDNDIVDPRGLEEISVIDEITTKRILFFGLSAGTVKCIVTLLYPISCCSLSETDKMDKSANVVINKLLQRIHLSDNDINKEMLQNILAFVRCSYRTHFLSLSRCPSLERKDNCIMEKVGLVYTSHACKSNMAECIAKHANYTYMTGDFQSTLEAANQLLARYARFPLQPPIFNSDISAQGNFIVATLLDAFVCGRRLYELFDNHCFLGLIIFLKNEIYALPDDARVELFCVISTGKQLQTICRNWFWLSPFAYVAYLAFLINIARGFGYKAKVYLKIMETICGKSISKESSSINLLGASYNKLGQDEKAMKMFRIAMKRQRDETNASVWHVARLLWRQLRDRWMETS